ncbi:Hypothetical protein APO_2084 [Acetobacter pomorum DM001]|uniref:Uncharacterized protein n=1 Tax=Acetobacter pomorum DM001 TaxID=945681 RepID=F1YVU2_9PROT|nr:Hypothetical protein APO_2084 [Acetobacter pomorum DM001]
MADTTSGLFVFRSFTPQQAGCTTPVTQCPFLPGDY